MSDADRRRWEERHRQPRALTPRPSLALLPRPRGGARALDVACGQGRHSLALHHAGYAVTAVDISLHALAHLRAAAAGAPILAVQADLDSWPFRGQVFDAVVQVDFLDRSRLPALADSLRPGGLLLIDTFMDAGHPNADGPRSADFRLSRGELPRVYRDLEILHYREEDGETARAVLLARRRI